jgi:hypothetical protein
MNRRYLLSSLTAGAAGTMAGCLGGRCSETTHVDFEPFESADPELQGIESFNPSDNVRALLEEVKENNGSLSVCNDPDGYERKEEKERRLRRLSAIRDLETTLRDKSNSWSEWKVRYDGKWYLLIISTTVEN